MNVWDAKGKRNSRDRVDAMDPSTFLQEVKCHLLRGAHFLLSPHRSVVLLLLLFASDTQQRERERESLGPTYSLLESITAHTRLYSHRCTNHHSNGFIPFTIASVSIILLISRKEILEIEIKERQVMLCI